MDTWGRSWRVSELSLLFTVIIIVNYESISLQVKITCKGKMLHWLSECEGWHSVVLQHWHLPNIWSIDRHCVKLAHLSSLEWNHSLWRDIIWLAFQDTGHSPGCVCLSIYRTVSALILLLCQSRLFLPDLHKAFITYPLLSFFIPPSSPRSKVILRLSSFSYCLPPSPSLDRKSFHSLIVPSMPLD